MLNNRHTKGLINIALILTIVFLFTKVGYTLKPIMDILGMLIMPIIISIFFYYSLRPIVEKLTDKSKRKGLMSLLVILGFFIMLVLVAIYGGAVIKIQFEEAFINNQGKLSDYKNFLNGKLTAIDPNLDIFTNVFDNIKNSILGIGTNLIKVFSGIGNIGTQIILIPFILFYLLKEDKEFIERFSSIIPKSYKKDIGKMTKKIDVILSTYINGQLTVALVIGTLMFAGYLIIGMPNALLMSAFSLITSIIPLIGPFLGILPAILIALTIEMGLVIKILIVALIVQQIEGNLITPNIIGNKLKIHPLAIMFIVLISVNLFGILGAFMGIPVYLILVTIGETIYKISKRKRIKN